MAIKSEVLFDGIESVAATSPVKPDEKRINVEIEIETLSDS